MRTAYLLCGFLALLLGGIGTMLPLLPTVPFIILAAFCFARSNPALERRLTEHAVFGSHIQAWRSRGAISRKGKAAAAAAFAASAAAGLVLLDRPLAWVPLIAALAGGTWVLSRPAD